jgi:hypothetical protein
MWSHRRGFYQIATKVFNHNFHYQQEHSVEDIAHSLFLEAFNIIYNYNTVDNRAAAWSYLYRSLSLRVYTAVTNYTVRYHLPRKHMLENGDALYRQYIRCSKHAPGD